MNKVITNIRAIKTNETGLPTGDIENEKLPEFFAKWNLQTIFLGEYGVIARNLANGEEFAIDLANEDGSKNPRVIVIGDDGKSWRVGNPTLDRLMADEPSTSSAKSEATDNEEKLPVGFQYWQLVRLQSGFPATLKDWQDEQDMLNKK